jgi:hypothetical protein
VVSRPAGVFSATSNRSTVTTVRLVLLFCQHHRELFGGWSTSPPGRAVENARQHRFRIVQILNVPQRVLSPVFTRSGFAGRPFRTPCAQVASCSHSDMTA